MRIGFDRGTIVQVHGSTKSVNQLMMVAYGVMFPQWNPISHIPISLSSAKRRTR